jgi:hypothetical protein
MESVMETSANERPAADLLSQVSVDNRVPALMIAKAQAHAILALAEQLGRIANVLEEQNRRPRT